LSPADYCAQPPLRLIEGPRVQSTASQRFLRFAIGYWRGDARWHAWILTGAVLFFLLANLGAALAVNRWNKFFFDALERKDTTTVTFAIGLVIVLAIISAAMSVGLLHARMRLQVRWRRWLTRTLIARWLANRHFYQLTVIGTEEAQNPEGRIAEDGRLAIELLVDFALGVLNATLAAISFIGVLWVVGGAITIAGYTIPGYMVFACVIYCTLTTVTMYFLGKRLVTQVEKKAGAEAQFRYEVTRVRDNAETIALIGGDEDERGRLDETYSHLFRRWIRVIVWQGRMTWVSGANMVLLPVVPLLLGAPKYLAGEMSLGSLMQAATAFAQVQVALNWLADNAVRLADWFASSRRVSQLADAIGRLEESLGPLGDNEGIEISASPNGNIHLKELDIEQYDGTLMIDDAEAIVKPGEKVLVKGDSGTGKSTLIRAMAGLWPWGSGKILKPEDAEFAFMPQRPYFPLGNLRQALLYPHPDQKVDEEKIGEALTRVGLDHLIPRLDEVENWSQVLSGGEQQRAAFARVMIRPPDILIMDEPTSSLDELSQFRMMEYMRDFLPKTTVIHVGHRPGLEPFHDREIKLVRKKRGGPATTEEGPAEEAGTQQRKEEQAPRKTLFSRALRRFRRRRDRTKALPD
jgi:vitamin B12/bleomycin/antimicrobial peptide transport system ATP-binding/permease protein